MYGHSSILLVHCKHLFFFKYQYCFNMFFKAIVCARNISKILSARPVVLNNFKIIKNKNKMFDH